MSRTQRDNRKRRVQQAKEILGGCVSALMFGAGFYALFVALGKETIRQMPW